MEDQGQKTAKTATATVIAFLLLVFTFYAAYRYSQTKSSNIILPGGVSYLGQTPTPVLDTSQPSPTPPPKFTITDDVPWNTKQGNLYPYSFSYPATLPLVVFPSDGTDSVAIVYNDIPKEQNVLLNIDLIEIRDKTYTTKPKREYIENWWKFFPGLKGVGKLEQFTNSKGLKGYRVNYTNTQGQTPNLDVFFEIPGQNKFLIHLANGILEEKIFTRIVDSVAWDRTKPIKQLPSTSLSPTTAPKPSP